MKFSRTRAGDAHGVLHRTFRLRRAVDGDDNE
jgi:hypothetical protein